MNSLRGKCKDSTDPLISLLSIFDRPGQIPYPKNRLTGSPSKRNLLTQVFFFLQCSLPPTCTTKEYLLFERGILSISLILYLCLTIRGLFHDRNCTLH